MHAAFSQAALGVLYWAWRIGRWVRAFCLLREELRFGNQTHKVGVLWDVQSGKEREQGVLSTQLLLRLVGISFLLQGCFLPITNVEGRCR